MFTGKTMTALNAFLEAASKELGFEVNHVRLSCHNRDGTNTKRFAKTLEEDGFTIDQWQDGGSASFEDYTKPVSIVTSYFFSLDAPEEDDNTCIDCGETADNDENALCPECDRKLMEEWEAQDKHQKTEYRSSAL